MTPYFIIDSEQAHARVFFLCCSAGVGGRTGKLRIQNRATGVRDKDEVARNLKAGIGSSPRPNDAFQVCPFPDEEINPGGGMGKDGFLR
jgi:hypothetical protein